MPCRERWTPWICLLEEPMRKKHKGYTHGPTNSTQDDETQTKIILYDNEAKCLSLW